MIDSLKDFINSLDSISVQNEGKLDALTDIDSVAIVGSTCSGKSMMADAVRDSRLSVEGAVDVPLRYITRPVRGKDNTTENIHVSIEDFQKMVDGGEIGLNWVRKMEGNREERYGFHTVNPNKFPVYSGNNALFNNADSIRPREILKHTLLIGVNAPDDIRKERLIARSPDLIQDCPDEVEYRLGDSSSNMLPHIHVSIDNHGELEGKSAIEMVKLIEHIIQTREGFIRALEPPREEYRGRLLRVVTQKMMFPGKREKRIEYAERPPGARVLATDGEHVLMMKEWRIETGNWDFRLPGGKVFDSLEDYLKKKDEPDVDMDQIASAGARRELEEETGLSLPAEAFTKLHRSTCGATVVWDLHYYLAKVDKHTITPTSVSTQEGERTHPSWFTYKEVQDLCLQGHVQEDRTLAVLLKFLLSKQQT